MVHLEPSWVVITGVLAQRRCVGAVDRATTRHLRVHGLTVNEFLLLAVLADRLNATTRGADLAKNLGLTTGGITRLVDRAVVGGYVERRPNDDDKRSQLIAMTPLGQKRLEAATPGFTDLVRAVLDRDTDRRLESLARSVSGDRPCSEHGGVRLGLLFIVVCLGAAGWGWTHSTSAPNGATLLAVEVTAAAVLIIRTFVRSYRRAEREGAAHTKRMESGMQQDTTGDHIWDA